MQDLIAFVMSNKEGLLLVATSTVTLASALAAVTPTPKDDKISKWLYKIVDLIALNVGKAKDK
jgi:hypothetical protein